MSYRRSAFAVIIISAMMFASFTFAFAGTVTAEDDDSTFTSFYDQLSDNEKAVYDEIAVYSADTLTVTVDLPNAVYTQIGTDESAAKAYLMEQVAVLVQAAYYSIEMDDPLAICTWGNSTVSWSEETLPFVTTGTLIGLEQLVLTAIIDENYADDTSTTGVNELQDKIDALNDAIEAYSVGSTDLRTMVGNINSYLTGRLTYDSNAGTSSEGPYVHDAYGALVSSSKLAVCDGFSKGFQALCDKYGIDCYTVLGYSVPELEGHAWNVVLMGNGSWYPIDVTWNKSSDNAYMLISADSFNSSHQAGLYTSDGGVSMDYPVLSETKYDSDPWYENTYVEWALMAAIGLAIVIGILLAVREDKKKLTAKKK